MTQDIDNGYYNNTADDVVRLFIIRHGQTDHNVKKILQGHRDIPLNGTGIKQGQQLGEYLLKEHIKFDAMYSSDLTRCQETTQEIVQISQNNGDENNKVPPTIKLNSDLRERFMGPIEGLHILEAERYADKHGKGSFRDFGESPEVFVKRLQNGINKSVEDAINNGYKNIAIVSHGGAIRAIMQWLQPDNESKIIVFNTSVTIVDFDKKLQEFQVKSIGNTKHLGDGEFLVSDLRLR